MRRVKDANALAVCQVHTVGMAIDAVAKGADTIVAQGGEAGGHGISQGSFTLVPAVVERWATRFQFCFLAVLLMGGGWLQASCWARKASSWERAFMRAWRPLAGIRQSSAS